MYVAGRKLDIVCACAGGRTARSAVVSDGRFALATFGACLCSSVFAKRVSIGKSAAGGDSLLEDSYRTPRQGLLLGFGLSLCVCV